MRRVLPSRVLLSLALGGLPGAACTSDEPSPRPASIPDVVQRAFEGSCMHEGCHDADARAAGLSLDAADSLGILGGPSSQSELPLVVVGELAGSYMAIKLLPDDQLPEGAVRHQERMPLDGIESDDVDRINTILSWIAGLPLPEGTSGDDPTDPTDDPTSAPTGTGTGTPGDGSSGTSGSTGEPPDSGPGTNSGGGSGNPACSVEEVTEGAVSDPLDKGGGAGQIPLPVGVVLEERCGCHTLADRELNTKYPALLAPAATLFLDYGDVTAIGPSLDNEIFVVMSMPPGSCPSIPADDLAVLDKWFNDGQPDGATFEPP